MATQEVIDQLTAVAQDCLESKIQAGFDASAALTVDIALEIAQAMEIKANEYTDVKISEVLTELTNNEVDLGPFTEFMAEIYELLDGDDLTDGFQIFNLLATDASAALTTLAEHTVTLQTIQNNLTTFQNTLTDHSTRIAALEAAQHEPMDCEDCHDEILNLVDGSMDAACIASDVALATYRTTTSASVLAAFQAEMNPSTATFSAISTIRNNRDVVTVSGVCTDENIATIRIQYFDGPFVDIVPDYTLGTWEHQFYLGQPGNVYDSIEVEALDSSGNILETVDLTHSTVTPFTNYGLFGIENITVDGEAARGIYYYFEGDPVIADVRIVRASETLNVPENVSVNDPIFYPEHSRSGTVGTDQEQVVYATDLTVSELFTAGIVKIYFFNAAGEVLMANDQALFN